MRVRIVFYQHKYNESLDKAAWLFGDLTPEKLEDITVGATKFKLNNWTERCVEVNKAPLASSQLLSDFKDLGYIVEYFRNVLDDTELPLNNNGLTLNEWRAERSYKEDGN